MQSDQHVIGSLITLHTILVDDRLVTLFIKLGIKKYEVIMIVSPITYILMELLVIAQILQNIGVHRLERSLIGFVVVIMLLYFSSRGSKSVQSKYMMSDVV